MNHEEFLEQTFASRPFQAIYSEKDLARWRMRNKTPVNDRLCREAFWFGQTTLLAEKRDMEQIADAFRKVHRFAAELAG